MAHRFDTEKSDPYSLSAHAIEQHVFPDETARAAGASEELFDQLGDAIVAALGDIGAAAIRLGLTQTSQIHGLAAAVGAVARPILESYLGEVDSEPALRALEQDPRLLTLSDIDQDQMKREIAQTRALEALLPHARRLPNLIDFAGSMGLTIPEEEMAAAPYLLSAAESPSPGSTAG